MKASVAGFRGDLNIAPVPLHNSLNGVETEAGTFSNSFGSKERFEDVSSHIRWDPRAVISNFDYNAIVLAIRSDTKLAFAVHGVNRVVDDVGPNLIQFTPERIHEKRNALVVALHDDSVFELVVQDGQRGFQALYDVDVLQRSLVHVGVFLDGTDQIRDSRRTVLDFV